MDKFFSGQIHFGGGIAAAAKVRKHGRAHGYAAKPGTGPRGQRCATCAYCLEVVQGVHRVRKCQVVVRKWTPGPETNIKHNAPACSEWARKAWRRVTL